MRPSGVFNTSYNQDMAIVRTRTQWGLLIALLLFLTLYPRFFAAGISSLTGGIITLTLLIVIGYTVIAVHGLNILFGYAGQISVGQTAFMAVGAYTSANLMEHFGLNWFLALPLAGLSAALVGLLFGLPSLRLKGFYLAMATFAAFFIILYLVNNLDDILHQLGLGIKITGGMMGFRAPRPEAFGFAFDTETRYYYLVTALVVLMTFFAKNIVRSRVGRAFVAVRDNDIAAEVMGIDVFRYKLLAFAIGNFYAGVAGSLYGHYVGFLTPEFFTFIESVWMLGMVVIGGMGYTAGPIFGTVFMRVLVVAVVLYAPRLESLVPFLAGRGSAALGAMAWSLALMVFLIFEPRGLAHRWQLFKASYRLHPFSY